MTKNKYYREFPDGKRSITLEDIYIMYNVTSRHLKETLTYIWEAEGAKYSTTFIKKGTDVHGLCYAFGIKNSAVLHAVKKILCVGKRGHKDMTQDLEEIISVLARAYNIILTEG